MSDASSSKKVLLSTIGIAVLIIVFVGVAFAFFNYTRTGSANNIKVGRISFVSKNEQTISLTNLFPIDPTEAGIMEDDTKVGTYEIEIKGDADYNNGVEYLVSVVDANIYTNQNQIVPISLDFTISNGLGTSNDNYFIARESKNASIYKKLVGDTLVGDEMLLVGFIKSNTTSGTAEGVDGKITIKAYLDKNNILISDTYDGSESDNMGTANIQANNKTIITTSEWNALQNIGVSFKVKVEANEGIWVKGSLEEIMRKTAVMDNVSSEFVTASTGIDFGAVSSDTNGKGVYMRAGTQNDTYPILYYRGEVEDNNVYYANKCWKAVRTTETGGVKLIYNGEMTYNKTDLVRSEYGEIVTDTGNFTFDTTDYSWNAKMTETVDIDTPYEISFNLPIGKYYVELLGSMVEHDDYAWSEIDVKINNNIIEGAYIDNSLLKLKSDFIYNKSNSNDILSFIFYGEDNTSQFPSTVKFKLRKEDSSLGMSCNNLGEETGITLLENQELTNTFKFNNNANSLAYSGYMYGTVYESSLSNWTSGARFGSGFTWNGTNYILVDDSVTTPDNTHHYSCNVTTENGTCTSLRYVFYAKRSNKYYIVLENGKSIEDAIQEMQTNTNNSNAKNQIDIWYSQNMLNYSNQLEDTIWCNDRSIGDGNNNGWIANGGAVDKYWFYGPSERGNDANNTSTVKNQPRLSCINKNDAFTVNDIVNGNGALTYPIALMTSDEMVLAGGVDWRGNIDFYLNNAHFYLLSPYSYRLYYLHDNSVMSSEEYALSDGSMYSDEVNINSVLRPSISLKHGTPVASGTGTAQDPYVIE